MLDGQGDFVLLDLRQEVDKKFRIEDQRLVEICLDLMQEHWQKIPKGKKVVLIDLIGKQSPIAGRFLHGKGFTDVVKVSGGIGQYLKDGYPVTSVK